MGKPEANNFTDEQRLYFSLIATHMLAWTLSLLTEELNPNFPKLAITPSSLLSALPTKQLSLQPFPHIRDTPPPRDTQYMMKSARS